MTNQKNSGSTYTWPALFMLNLHDNIEQCVKAIPAVKQDALKEYRLIEHFALDYFGTTIAIKEKMEILAIVELHTNTWEKLAEEHEANEATNDERCIRKYTGRVGESVVSAAKRAWAEARQYVNDYISQVGYVSLHNMRHIFLFNEQEIEFNPWRWSETERMAEVFMQVLQKLEEEHQKSPAHQKFLKENEERQATANEMVENLGAFFEMDGKEKMEWIREFLEIIDYRSIDIDYDKIFKTFQENDYNTASTLEAESDLVKSWTELKAAYTKYMTQRFFEVLHFRLRSTGNPIAGTGVPPSVFDQLHKFKELE